jgi:hypothetical protein
MKLIFSALIVMGVSFAAASSFAADSRNVSVVNELRGPATATPQTPAPRSFP